MIATLLMNFLGYGVFVGLIYGVWRATSRRWRRLASVYGSTGSLNELTSCDSKRMQTVILVGGDIGWNSYKGITTVGVTREGISLRLMAPFSIFHPPLLVPFRDIRIEPKRWYLFGKSFQLTLAGVADVQLILHDELVDWIALRTADLPVEEQSRFAGQVQVIPG